MTSHQIADFNIDAPPSKGASAVCNRLRSKHCFATEQELVAAIRTTFPASAWTWLSELKSANGVADLVAVKSSASPGPPSLNDIAQRWVYPLKCLPSHISVTATCFAQQFATSAGYAREILHSYHRAGFCEYAAGTKTWTKVRDPLPVVERIVALEVKLRDWRRALYQATRYLDYATQAWVVLDHRALAAALAHADDFVQRGIGLMGLSRAGEIEVIAHPAKRGPRMPARYWQANAEIARRLATSAPQELAVEALQAV
jgi:hypothetical protein